MSKVCYSKDGDIFWSDYQSVYDELSDLADGERSSYFIGEREGFSHESFVSVDSIIENIQEIAYDECSDHSDGYLDDLDEEDKKELSELISGFFDKKLSPPSFFKVANVKEIKGVWSESDREFIEFN